jgi:hypothetical protein
MSFPEYNDSRSFETTCFKEPYLRTALFQNTKFNRILTVICCKSLSIMTMRCLQFYWIRYLETHLLYKILILC